MDSWRQLSRHKHVSNFDLICLLSLALVLLYLWRTKRKQIIAKKNKPVKLKGMVCYSYENVIPATLCWLTGRPGR